MYFDTASAAVYASDGFSQAEMQLVFGDMLTRMGNRHGHDLKIWQKAGFTDEQQKKIVKKLKEQVEAIFSDSYIFLPFFSPMNGHTPSDGKRHGEKFNDGKRRAYTGKNEIARDYITRTAQALGIAELTVNARLANAGENFDDLIKFAPNGQPILSNQPGLWEKAPLDMSQDLFTALRNNPQMKAKVFDFFTKDISFNFALFGDDEAKVKAEFEDCLINLFEQKVQSELPNATACMRDSFLHFNENSSNPTAREQVSRYKAGCNALQADLTRLKEGNGDQVQFFVNLDRLTSSAAVFGHYNEETNEFEGGVPKDLQTFTMLKDILENGDFDKLYCTDRVAIKTNALLRVIDATYSKDAGVQKAAMDFLNGGNSLGKSATELVNEFNKEIEKANQQAKKDGHPEKLVDTIDPGKQPGLKWTDASQAEIYFDPEDKLLKINALMVSMPPIRASIAIWKKAEELDRNDNQEALEKLLEYIPYYKVKFEATERSVDKRFGDLNDDVAKDLKDLINWKDFTYQIDEKCTQAVNSQRAKTDKGFKNFVDNFTSEVENLKEGIRNKANEEREAAKKDGLGPKETEKITRYEKIILANLTKLTDDLVADGIGEKGIVSLNKEFNSAYFDATFAKIKKQADNFPKDKPDIILYDDILISEATKRLMQMSDADAAHIAYDAMEEFNNELEGGLHKEQIVFDKGEYARCAGKTYAKLVKMSYMDAVATDDDEEKKKKGNLDKADPNDHKANRENGKNSKNSDNLIHNGTVKMIFKDAKDHTHTILTTGKNTLVKPNEHGELPPFEVWKNMAAMYKKMGVNKIDFDCNDQYTAFLAGMAFANMGIELRNTSISLDSAQAEAIRAVRQAAIRQDWPKTDENGRELETNKTIFEISNKQPLNILNEEGKELKNATNVLPDKEAKLNHNMIDASQNRLAEAVRRVNGMTWSEKLDFCDGVSDANDEIKKDPKQRQERFKGNLDLLAKHFPDAQVNKLKNDRENEKLSPESILLLAKLYVIKSGEKIYNRLNAGTALTKQEWKKQDGTTPGIDDSLKEYLAAKDKHHRSDFLPEIQEKADNLDKATAYMFALWRKEPYKLAEIITDKANRGNLSVEGLKTEAKDIKEKIQDRNLHSFMGIAEKISNQEKLNLFEIEKVAGVIASSCKKETASFAQLFEQEQKARTDELKSAYRELSGHGSAITDKNMKTLGGYVYTLSSNEVLDEVKGVLHDLKAKVDKRAAEKFAKMGESIGNAELKNVTKLEDLRTIKLSDEDFEKCKNYIGIEKEKDARATEKNFYDYLKKLEKVKER